MVFSGFERHPILLRANVGLSPHPPALHGKAQDNGVSSREGYQLWGEQGFNSLPPAAVARPAIHGLLFSMQRRWVGRAGEGGRSSNRLTIAEWLRYSAPRPPSPTLPTHAPCVEANKKWRRLWRKPAGGREFIAPSESATKPGRPISVVKTNSSTAQGMTPWTHTLGVTRY